MLDIRNCDNMDLMREFPDKYFDLAIVDPPYGIDGNSHRKNKSRGKLIMSKDYHTALWDQPIPTDEYFTELFRVSKNQIIFGGNYFSQLAVAGVGNATIKDLLHMGVDESDLNVIIEHRKELYH